MVPFLKWHARHAAGKNSVTYAVQIQQLADPDPESGTEPLLLSERLELIQDDVAKLKGGSTKFLMSGYAAIGYEDLANGPARFRAEFDPLFLWKLTEQISYETELVFTNVGNREHFQFVFGNLSYHFNDYLTLSAGKFLTPFGIYSRRLKPMWINKLINWPLHTSLVPFFSTGALLSGGFDAGPTQFNWALYADNGPDLVASGPGQGTLRFDNYTDTNQNKGVGGRIGFLPLPELELGGSFYFAGASPEGLRNSEDNRLRRVDAMLLGMDLSFTKTFSALKGAIDIRSEWAWSDVDDARYLGSDFTFNNRRQGGYAQIAYRPTLLEHGFLKNLEPVFRYEFFKHPEVPGAEGAVGAPHFAPPIDRVRRTLGLNYWLGSSTVLKFEYQRDSRDEDSFLMQWAVGF